VGGFYFPVCPAPWLRA